MKKIIQISILSVCLVSLGLLYYQPAMISGSRITNYYYYQGQKFYFQERTDIIFLKFKKEISETSARSILLTYPDVDVVNTTLRMNDDNFIRLKSKLNNDDYLELINEMRTSDKFDNVDFAFSPLGIDDNKTFYGMNNLLILQFKNSLTRAEIDNINSSNDVQIVEKIDVTGGETFLARVKPGAKINAMEMSNKYYEDGYVNYSEPSLYVTNVLCDTLIDEFYPLQWALRNVGNNIPGNPPNTIADCDMDVDSAWNVTKGDSTILIAILDTGVDTTHPDIGRVPGYDFVNNDGNPNDDGNHGTACAGIAAATGNNVIGVAGVAYRCRIMPVKIINSGGSIPGYHVSAFGTIWAYQHGASVLSNSWGFTGGASSLMYNAINDAARYGRGGKGSILCYASGNENTSPMRFPAITDAEMVVVGGLAPCDKRKSPTDGCSGESWGASFGPTLDIVAPCVKIYTTDRVGSPGYSSGNYYPQFNGTSSATPNCAGVCALVVSANPNLTRKEVEALISLSAEKVGTYSYTTVKEYGNWNNEMGYGRLNARLALLLMSSLFDKVKPDIYHDSPALSSPDSLARTVSAIIRDNKMVATGTNRPRLYFRVNAGSFSFVNAFSTVGDTFKFTIPGQTPNSTIDYYFAAQDTAGTPNLQTLPAGGSGINPPGTTPPASFFTYKIGKYKVQSSTTTPKVCINNSTIYDTINVTGVAGTIVDIDVTINISNREDGDVDVYVRKSAAQSELTTDNGGSSDSYVRTVFDDEASIPITSGTPPYTGRFRPETPLTTFDGLDVDGAYVLQYTDDASTGFNSSLDSWLIEITYQDFIGIIHNATIPSKYYLAQNYPNPFNPVTVIEYGLLKKGFVSIVLYDVTGKEVAQLINSPQDAGTYKIDINSEDYSLSSGIYFYKISVNNFSEVRKMVLLK